MLSKNEIENVKWIGLFSIAMIIIIIPALRLIMYNFYDVIAIILGLFLANYTRKKVKNG